MLRPEFVIENGVPRWSGGRLVPMGGGQFIGGNSKLKFTFDKDGKPMSAETVDADGEVTRFAPETVWTPTPDGACIIQGRLV